MLLYASYIRLDVLCGVYAITAMFYIKTVKYTTQMFFMYQYTLTNYTLIPRHQTHHRSGQQPTDSVERNTIGRASPPRIPAANYNTYNAGDDDFERTLPEQPTSVDAVVDIAIPPGLSPASATSDSNPVRRLDLMNLKKQYFKGCHVSLEGKIIVIDVVAIFCQADQRKTVFLLDAY
jgi:hypothetical protein